MRDPFLSVITQGELLYIAAVLELAVALAVTYLLRKHQTTALAIVLWLSVLFLLYRIGLTSASGSSGASCKCLAAVFDRQSDTVALILLGYLLGAGSLIGLACHVCVHRRGDQLISGAERLKCN
jgi:hypothetical protein